MSHDRKRSAANDWLPEDRIEDLLTSRRRRYTLYCLYLYANPIRLPDVAERITAWEHDLPSDQLLDERLRIYNSLYHTHVPKLEAADVVVYSQSEDMVELGRNAAQLRPRLHRRAEAELNGNDVLLI